MAMNAHLTIFLLIAVLNAVIICAVYFYNDSVLKLTLGYLDEDDCLIYQHFAFNNDIIPREFHGVYDKSGKNVIIKNVILADDQPMKHDVSVVTQLDASRIENVIKMTERWNGPVHVTVVIVSPSVWNLTIEIVEKIRACKIKVRKHVTWHMLVMMHSSQNKTKYVYKSQENYWSSLQKRTESFKFELYDMIKKIKSETIRLGPPGTTDEIIAYYPQTIAMNVGLKCVKTDFFLAVDGDVYPNLGARDGFIKMGANLHLFNDVEMPPPYQKLENWPNNGNIRESICCPHRYLKNPPHDVYVLPTFEVTGELPYDVTTLKEAYSSKTARPFYVAAADIYTPTKHDKWISESDGGDIECSYEVKYAGEYEPFFIARTGVALFDERFIGHSHVDVHHVALLAAIGYKFKILKNAFLVHEGFKSANPLTGQKLKEANSFRGVYRGYLEKLERTYGRYY